MFDVSNSSLLVYNYRIEWCSYRASGDFVCLAVIVLVVWRVSITGHSHDVGEHGAGPVVLVRVKEDSEAFKLVRGAEDISLGSSLLGEPHGETISVKVALAGDLELNLDLFV